MLKYSVSENPYIPRLLFFKTIKAFNTCLFIVAGKHLESNFKDYDVSAMGLLQKIAFYSAM